MANKKRQHSEDKFNFFVPATFEKGKKGSKDVVRVKGIASTVSAVDSDGETLFPEGFDYNPLLQKGFLNWDHQQKSRPAAIVGEPDVAKVINGGKDFYIEGFLYDSEEGRQVANLAQVLEKNSSTRRLGYSIEGQVIERGCGPEFLDKGCTIRNPEYDPKLWKQVTRARITGVAITPCPKNPNTILSLVKGEYSDLYVENEDEEEDACPECGRTDKEACPKCKEVKKAMTAEGQEHTRPESVEGVKYDKKKNDFTITDESPKVGRSVRKSEIYDLIAENYTTDVIKAKQIYSFIESVNSKMFNMNQNEISQEAIDQAFDFLNKSAKSDINKEGAESDKKDEDGDDDDMEKAKQMCKGLLESGLTKGDAIDSLVKSGFSLEVSSAAAETVAREMSNIKENGGTITSVTPAQVTETAPLSKGELEELLKGLFATSQGETENLIKGLADEISAPINGAMDRKFEAVGRILKATMDQNSTLRDTIEKSQSALEELSERLVKIESQSQGRKSLTSTVTAQERFAKSESAASTQGIPAGAEVFSMSNAESRGDLMDRIDAEIMKSRTAGRTPSQVLVDAVAELEICKSLPNSAVPLLKSLNIHVTK